MLNNPDFLVGLTDLLLSIEACIFAVLYLRRSSAPRALVVAFFILLGAASFSGAIFHVFFPLKVATSGGWIVWLIVTASTGLTAIALWALAIWGISGKRSLYLVAYIGPVLFAAFMYWIVVIDYHYGTVIAFYAPALVAFGGVAFYKALQKKAGWGQLFLGVALSAIAALVQLSSLSVMGFDHNALYHLLQAIALFVLYRGFCQVRG